MAENKTDKKDDIAEGQIPDESMHKIEGKTDDRPTGQDHSTENLEDRMPKDGVGAIQDSSLIKEDVAHIEDNK